LDARLTTFLCRKKITVVKSKEMKTEWSKFNTNLAEFSKKGYGSKRAILPVY
jgi:hypothetical protein